MKFTQLPINVVDVALGVAACSIWLSIESINHGFDTQTLTRIQMTLFPIGLCLA